MPLHHNELKEFLFSLPHFCKTTATSVCHSINTLTQSDLTQPNNPPNDSLRNNKGGIVLSTDRFIREKECQQLTGLSRSCRYRLEKAGQFPSRRKLGGRSVGWSLSEVLAWKDSREAVH